MSGTSHPTNGFRAAVGEFLGWTISQAFPPRRMYLPAILQPKAQGERRKRSANLPKIVRTGEYVGFGGGQ
jgi:hypothetical protein